MVAMKWLEAAGLDLAKFRPFGKIIKSLLQFLSVYLVIDKI